MTIRDSKETYNIYMRKYHLDWYYKRKKILIDLLGGKCVSCRSKNDLEFDHKDPGEKTFSISKKITTLSMNELKEELKKCQLLCKICHIDKSMKEKGQMLARGTHGTLSSYRYCKCELCREAKRNYTREYRARKNQPV